MKPKEHTSLSKTKKWNKGGLRLSTRSYICKENPDGTYTGIYCHSDGYLTYNGAMLLDHYNSRERVEKLISLGNLSCLNENIEPDPTKPHSFDFNERQENVCVFYGRDRGETGQEPHPITLEEINSPESWIEYCYIFGQDNQWKFFECGRMDRGIRSLQEGLDMEYESLGFPRPENYYGFFSPASAEHYRLLHQQGLKKAAGNEEMV